MKNLTRHLRLVNLMIMYNNVYRCECRDKSIIKKCRLPSWLWNGQYHRRSFPFVDWTFHFYSSFCVLWEHFSIRCLFDWQSLLQWSEPALCHQDIMLYFPALLILVMKLTLLLPFFLISESNLLVFEAKRKRDEEMTIMTDDAQWIKLQSRRKAIRLEFPRSLLLTYILFFCVLAKFQSMKHFYFQYLTVITLVWEWDTSMKRVKQKKILYEDRKRIKSDLEVMIRSSFLFWSSVFPSRFVQPLTHRNSVASEWVVWVFCCVVFELHILAKNHPWEEGTGCHHQYQVPDNNSNFSSVDFVRGQTETNSNSKWT